MKSMSVSRQARNVIVALLLCKGYNTQAFSQSSNTRITTSALSVRRYKNRGQRRSSPLHMALTPIGPFCPFRSSSAADMENRMADMAQLNSVDPDFPAAMNGLQEDIQRGQTSSPERLMKVANGIERAIEPWENLIMRLRLSIDYQTREYAKLTQAHLATHGVTVESYASMMRWQAGCMKAMAQNTMPPMPPDDLDLNELMRKQQDKNAQQRPSVTAMSAAEVITSSPFTGDEAIFESPTVKEEFKNLNRDHLALVEFGKTYGEFDPLGKLRYLDEIEKIEERWDVFFARVGLTGDLNKDYVRQCNDFLASMGMDEDGFRTLLNRGHKIMRKEAEAERNRLGL